MLNADLTTLKLLLSSVLIFVVASPATAALIGPYTADANTTYLYHLDEAAGGSVAVNAGTAATSAVSYDGTPYAGDGVNQTTVTTVLGAIGYSSFGNAANLSAANDLGLGVDVSGDGGFRLDDNSPLSNDRLADHSTIFGSGNAFTLEAMVNLPAVTGSNREIIATDNSAGNADRGFQFRVTSTGSLEFNYIGVATTGVTAVIPTTGAHAFLANEWFHAAVSHDGTNVSFYWTRVDPAFTAANLIGGPVAEAVDVNDDAVLVIGNEGRVVGTTGSTEGLLGLIDEVRISNIARNADGFIFAVPEPTSAALMVILLLGLAPFARKYH
jgi:hypothetical protein